MENKLKEMKEVALQALEHTKEQLKYIESLIEQIDWDIIQLNACEKQLPSEVQELLGKQLTIKQVEDVYTTLSQIQFPMQQYIELLCIKNNPEDIFGEYYNARATQKKYELYWGISSKNKTQMLCVKECEPCLEELLE